MMKFSGYRIAYGFISKQSRYVICKSATFSKPIVLNSMQLAAKKKNRNRKNDRLQFDESAKDTWTTTEVETATSNTEGLSDNVVVGLKAEIASPFRSLRVFFYVAIGMSAGLGLFFSIPQLILALQKGDEQIPLQTIITNIAINLGGVGAGVFLWNRENNQSKEQLERFQEKEKITNNQLTPSEKIARETEIGLLPIEIQVSESNENTTRIVAFKDLQSKGKQNIIVFAATYDTVKDAVISAKIEGVSLFNMQETFIVPVVLGDELQNQLEDGSSKGFATKEGLMSAPYIGKPTQLNVWQAYLKKEVDLAITQGSKDIKEKGLVLVVNRSGKIIRRGVGIPPWKTVVEEVEKSNL
eukprot:gene1941-3765_t